MNKSLKKYLLTVYFCFQCIATVVNFLIFIYLIIISATLYGLGASNITTPAAALPFITIAGLVIILAQLYVIITPISASATIRIHCSKPLTKLQKFSAITFPVITIPLYSYLIFKIFI